VAEKRHANHSPIDDDFDDDDIMSLVHANVTGVYHKHGTPEHIAYTRDITALSQQGHILNRRGVIEMRNEKLTKTVGTVAFSMPEVAGQEERASVLLHIKLDDHARTDEVIDWVMEAVRLAGGEWHNELCGPGDTTE